MASIPTPRPEEEEYLKDEIVPGEDIYIRDTLEPHNRYGGILCQSALNGFSENKEEYIKDDDGNTIISVLVNLKKRGYKGQIPKGHIISYRDRKNKVFTIRLTHDESTYVPTRNTSSTIGGYDAFKFSTYSFAIGLCVAFLIIAIAAMIYPPCQ